MTPKNQIKKYAKALGWQYLRRNGNHEVWISPSGRKMGIPTTPSNAGIKRTKANLRRYS